ncbi:hypothetical protein [Streptomyces sp. AC154]|uniref:hypothetical protein n=1 Tax=Streptomyces sp. AC154 TaxID=3143184 RepID=UPI003F7F091B
MPNRAHAVHMTTTETPLPGREVDQSWMIWGAQAGSLGQAMSELEATAASHQADTVMAVRVTTVTNTRTRTRLMADPMIETTVVYQAYGTAVRYA